VCELAIGASGALMPLAFAATRALYVASAFGSEPGSPWLVLEQVALGALVLLPPTLAMGMTLPILARVAERAGDSLGRGVALLAGVAGNSAYAFSLMLFAFLLGLGAGAALARRWLRGARRVPAVLGLAELGLAATVLGGAFLWDRVPGYFASFALYPLTRTFG